MLSCTGTKALRKMHHDVRHHQINAKIVIIIVWNVSVSDSTKVACAELLSPQRDSYWCVWPETSHSQMSHPHPRSFCLFALFTLRGSHTLFPRLFGILAHDLRLKLENKQMN